VAQKRRKGSVEKTNMTLTKRTEIRVGLGGKSGLWVNAGKHSNPGKFRKRKKEKNGVFRGQKDGARGADLLKQESGNMRTRNW